MFKGVVFIGYVAYVGPVVGIMGQQLAKGRSKGGGYGFGPPPDSLKKNIMAREITLTLTTDNRLQCVHDDGVTPTWYIPLDNAEIHGTIDGGAAAATAAKKQGTGPVVIVRAPDKPAPNYIFLDRIKNAGAFSSWTPGSDLTALNSFIDILEDLT